MNFHRINGWLSLLAAAVTGAFLIRSWRDLWILPAAALAAYVALFLLMWLWLIALGLCVSMKKTYEKPSPFYSFWLNTGYFAICALARVRIRAEGEEQLPDQPFLMVSNHRSNLDNMIESLVLRHHRLTYISKQSNFRIPLARRYMVRTLHLSIDREDVKQSFEIFMRAAAMIRDGVSSVGVYPEGTRSKTGALGEFHDGCFLIAQKAKCPLVVLTVTGTQNIHKNFPWRHTDVHVRVVRVFTPEELAHTRCAAISTTVHTLMQESIDTPEDKTASHRV